MNNLPKRKNTRLKEYDYSQAGYYFVTFCMKDRQEFFSHIVHSELILTKYGKIVDEVIKNLSVLYKVEIDYYVIMPDHIHLILILDELVKTTINGKIKLSVSDIIGKLKSYSSRKIREILKEDEQFHWQKSFYDRVIRNEKELLFIRQYIQNNPVNWEFEKNNPENLEM